jgi:hypothetical protein
MEIYKTERSTPSSREEVSAEKVGHEVTKVEKALAPLLHFLQLPAEQSKPFNHLGIPCSMGSSRLKRISSTTFDFSPCSDGSVCFIGSLQSANKVRVGNLVVF